jgi:hypothetical protein
VKIGHQQIDAAELEIATKDLTDALGVIFDDDDLMILNLSHWRCVPLSLGDDPLTDEIEIPFEASRPKYFPPDFNREQIVRETKADIGAYGSPLRARHHTHTKAPKNAPVEYIGYIEQLPPSYCGSDNRDRWSVCACCSVTHPKFFKNMVIVYFTEEGVIRCIGKDCFKRHNPELHAAAWKKYKAEEKRKLDMLYLISQLDKIPLLVTITEYNLEIIRSVDAFRAELAKLLDKVYPDDVWKHVRSGSLYLTSQHTGSAVSRDGREGEERSLTLQRVYGPLAGYEMLSPKRRRLAEDLENDLIALKVIADKPLDTMTDADRAQAVKLFTQAYRHSKATYGDVDELRQFTSAADIGTLNGWSKQEGSPMKMYVAFDGVTFSIGRNPLAMVHMKVRPAYNRELKQLPSISETAIAAE